MAYAASTSACLADTNTYIRIKNLSDFDFKDIIVSHAFGVSNRYPDIKAGSLSDYLSFGANVYPSPAVVLTVGTNLLMHQPSCLVVGRPNMSPGRFTYGLTVLTNYNPKLEIIRETNTPPDTKIESFGLKSSYKGTHTNTRVLNMTGLDFTDVTMTGHSIGQVKAGEASSYFDLEIGPFIPHETVVTFNKTLPGRGGAHYLWEATHMKFFRPYSVDQNDAIYDGWFTYALNIESNVYLNLVFSRD